MSPIPRSRSARRAGPMALQGRKALKGAERTTGERKVLAGPVVDDFSEEALRREAVDEVERCRPSGLSPQASSLMQQIYQRALPYAEKSGAPPHLFATHRNEVSLQPIVRGRPVYEAFAEAIASAHEEVLIQAYEWETDSEAVKLLLESLQALEVRRKQEASEAPPVRVRMIVNERPVLFNRLTGMELRPYANLAEAITKLGLDPRVVDVQALPHRHLAKGALHSKSLVVDGQIAFKTGQNPQHFQTFDAGYRFEGEVAYALREEFALLWGKIAGRKGEKLPPMTMSAALDRAPKSADVSVLLSSREADGNPFHRSAKNTQAQVTFAVMDCAKDRVRMMTSNLNAQGLSKRMLRAMKDGTDFEIVVPLGFNDKLLKQAPWEGSTNATTVKGLYRELAKQGIPRSRLQVRWYSEDGKNASVGDDGASHAKYLSADGQVVVVGSGNMDNQSFYDSRELNAVVDSDKVTQAWDDAVFQPVWDRSIPHDELP